METWDARGKWWIYHINTTWCTASVNTEVQPEEIEVRIVICDISQIDMNASIVYIFIHVYEIEL